MKKLKNCLAQGFAIKTLQGWVKTISVAALGAALFMVPIASKADPVGGPIPMTQYELIKCLASLVGDDASLVDSEAKAVYYAKKRLGLKPKAGFHPAARLTRLFLAEIVQDLLKLKGKDAVEALVREGIDLAGTGDQEMTQDLVLPTFDDPEFTTPLAAGGNADCSPSKKTKKSKISKIRKSKCKVKKAPKPQKPTKPQKPRKPGKS